jgi:hypothetical protein
VGGTATSTADHPATCRQLSAQRRHVSAHLFIAASSAIDSQSFAHASQSVAQAPHVALW